jgi:hypothetical protein
MTAGSVLLMRLHLLPLCLPLLLLLLRLQSGM